MSVVFTDLVGFTTLVAVGIDSVLESSIVEEPANHIAVMEVLEQMRARS